MFCGFRSGASDPVVEQNLSRQRVGLTGKILESTNFAHFQVVWWT